MRSDCQCLLEPPHVSPSWRFEIHGHPREVVVQRAHLRRWHGWQIILLYERDANPAPDSTQGHGGGAFGLVSMLLLPDQCGATHSISSWVCIRPEEQRCIRESFYERNSVAACE